jgi:phosphoribosylformimino-5-aminoimidazole carboxamide ribotide isomerase
MTITLYLSLTFSVALWFMLLEAEEKNTNRLRVFYVRLLTRWTLQQYVADLDAITGGHPNVSLFKNIADKTGLELMVDAGITNLKKAEKVLKSHVSKVIIGTETLKSTSFVAEAVEFFGNERVVVSLDLMGNRIISGFKPAGLAEPMALLREFQDIGVSQIIVLDLTKVGSREGVNLPFLRDVLRNIKAKVFVGGGVRDIKDLLELKDLGVFGVLVATALHSGKISPEGLKHVGLLQLSDVLFN